MKKRDFLCCGGAMAVKAMSPLAAMAATLPGLALAVVSTAVASGAWNVRFGALGQTVQWRTFGVEPHHVLLNDSGMPMVANGGILHAKGDKKRDLQRMDSSRMRMAPSTRECRGRRRLKDQRQGIWHSACSQQAAAAGSNRAAATPLLGSAKGMAPWYPELEPVFLKWTVGPARDTHWTLAG